MQIDSAWGASVHIKLAFRDRTRFILSARHLIADVCAEYLEPSESTSHVLMAINELLENIVKYSSDCRGSVEFDLAVDDQQPSVRMRTQNVAEPSHLAEVQRLLSQVIAAPDPLRYYDEMIALSGERSGSGLGLVRIRAEAGLNLDFRIQADVLGIEASGPVLPRRNSV